jgi:HEAT repeat protein
MRWLVLAALVPLGCGSRATSDWVARLDDPDVVTRRQAVRELAARTGEAAAVVPALVKALGDASGYVRKDAAAALGKFGPRAREAVPALTGALADAEPSVRQAAAAALRKIDPGSALGP